MIYGKSMFGSYRISRQPRCSGSTIQHNTFAPQLYRFTSVAAATMKLCVLMMLVVYCVRLVIRCFDFVYIFALFLPRWFYLSQSG